MIVVAKGGPVVADVGVAAAEVEGTARLQHARQVANPGLRSGSKSTVGTKSFSSGLSSAPKLSGQPLFLLRMAGHVELLVVANAERTESRGPQRTARAPC
jgi:hypothetical protein